MHSSKLLKKLSRLLAGGVLLSSFAATINPQVQASLTPKPVVDGLVSPDGRSVRLLASAGNCPSGYLCIYQDAGYARGIAYIGGYDSIRYPNLTNMSGINANDKLSSWVNNTKYYVMWFYDANYQGEGRCLPPNSSMWYVGDRDNDKASSIRTVSFCRQN